MNDAEEPIVLRPINESIANLLNIVRRLAYEVDDAQEQVLGTYWVYELLFQWQNLAAVAELRSDSCSTCNKSIIVVAAVITTLLLGVR